MDGRNACVGLVGDDGEAAVELDSGDEGAGGMSRENLHDLGMRAARASAVR